MVSLRPLNVLLIMADEHRPDALGCAGHPVVRTPHLDRLAAQGVRYANAYCNSPLCVPSRASFATGRYVHEVGCWDNATPYSLERAPSWGSHLTAAGRHVTAIGKLDFDPSGNDGFPFKRNVGQRVRRDTLGIFRNPPANRRDPVRPLAEAGEGQPFHVQRALADTDDAVQWLQQERPQNEPWVLWLNYLPPHFPLQAPREYLDRYPLEAVDMPFDVPSTNRHLVVEQLRAHFGSAQVTPEVTRKARRAYYALVSLVDDCVGRVLAALAASGQAEHTLVVYTADHGDSMGDHDLWRKCNMYDASAGVPLILRGPGVAAGRVITQPASLVDLIPTLAEATGVAPDPGWRGRSLLAQAMGGAPDLGLSPAAPAVLSEYHAHGTSHGSFMLRWGRYKYVYYCHFPAQLFDLDADPQELHDLAGNQAYEPVRAECHRRLLELVPDPEAVDARALADQAATIQALGLKEPREAGTSAEHGY